MGDSREGRREGRKEGKGREGKQGRTPMTHDDNRDDFFNSPGGKTKTNKTKAILKKCNILGTCLCSSPEATPLSPLALRFSILQKLQRPCQSQSGWQGGRELTLYGYSFLTLPQQGPVPSRPLCSLPAPSAVGGMSQMEGSVPQT